MNYSMIAATLSLASTMLFQAARPAATLTGDWITPDHSVVEVYSCGNNMVCARLVHINDRTAVDDKNPDAALRKRPLCGIELGRDFAVVDGNRAKNGKLYDPDSGKIYSAELMLEGDTLRVRGYVGVSMFGRTETWHRGSEGAAACKH
jgi:uncharacterized protein (DUF2147 family)